MIYDVLNAYREYLMKSCHHRPETARTYANRLENLFRGQSRFNILDELDFSKILSNLSLINYKNSFSQSKNALLYFYQFQNLELTNEQIEKINMLEKNTHKKYRKQKQITYTDIDKKIKYLHNDKLKLCYQVLIETGLRVAELSQIAPHDCTVRINEIHLNFIGKGGNKENIIFLKNDNPTLFENLKERIENTPAHQKVFYSAIYLQKKAKTIGCTCHDLRRICAKLEYKKTKSKKAVMKKLRHANMKNTNIYLRSKIKV